MEISQDEAQRIGENQLREEGARREREYRAANRRAGARVILASALGGLLSFVLIDPTKYAIASTLIGIAVAVTVVSLDED